MPGAGGYTPQRASLYVHERIHNHDGLEGMRSERCWHLCAYKPDYDMSLERNISAIRRFMHKRSDLKGFLF